MFRLLIRSITFAAIAYPVLASPNGGFVVDFDDPGLEFVRLFGDAQIRPEGGTVIGSNGETSGYLRLGQSLEATDGAVLFVDPRLHDKDADLFRLKLKLRNQVEVPTAAVSLSVISPDDPLVESVDDLTENTWGDLFRSTLLSGDGLPLLSTRTGISVGLALTANDPLDPAGDPLPCSGQIGPCLSIDLRLDGELIATTEESIGDKPWTTISISSAPTSIRRLTNTVLISEEVAGDLLMVEVPHHKGLTNVAIASSSGRESVGYGIDDVRLLHGSIYPDAGDFNEDGQVDLSDFFILVNSMNSDATVHAQGDYDFNGKVDLADFVGFRAAWTPELATSNAVPEPHAGVVLLGMLLPLMHLARSLCSRPCAA